MAPKSHNTNVPIQINRIIPVNSRSRLFASALAVCCASTICNGIDGMTMAAPKQATKTPYSPGPMVLDKKWTAHMKTPPATLAIISHPL